MFGPIGQFFFHVSIRYADELIAGLGQKHTQCPTHDYMRGTHDVETPPIDGN
jgi:hypothetical protein